MHKPFECLIIISTLLTFNFFNLFVYNKKTKYRQANYNIWLMSLFLALLLSITNKFILLYIDYNYYVFCLIVSVTLEFLYGPIFYLYVTEITSAKKIRINEVVLHFVPASLFIIIVFAFLCHHNYGGCINTIQIFKIAAHIQIIIYIFLSFKLFYRNSNYKKNFYRVWTIISIIFLSLVFIKYIVMYATTAYYNNDMLSFQGLNIFFVIIIIGIFYYSQIKIFSLMNLSEKQNTLVKTLANNAEINQDKKEINVLPQNESSCTDKCNNDYKYQRNRLSDSEAIQLYDKLVHYMETEKPYKMPSLTLPILADRIQTSTHNLSQVINRCAGTNFNNFINLYRINEARELMDKNETSKEKIITFMYESGFNSPSSFNNYFKKIIGVTPREYLNNAQTQFCQNESNK
ncbi:MAG: helix-turn-helix domain-containing protein [Firmicutes bacterium]|nr:helix-turn-helix domain-containing protein [Bacillota bacterium]